MKKFIVSAVTFIHILLINLSMIMIVAMLLLVFVNVVLRYVFNSGIYWSEEVALVLEVWFIFLSLGLGVKYRLHFSINLFNRERISASLNRALDMLTDIIYIFIGAIMIIYGSKLVKFTMRSIMPATMLPAGILYLVLPLSGFVAIVEAIFHIFGFNMFDEKLEAYFSGQGGRIRDILRS
ncbi:MAG TPA: TRAP transporter small permease subunit [Rectinema sp.]|nr:TRAP transporter small permease subunit [Rectinema sp.]HPV58982.1 TRAP transporter small permease subunit [Rectinema sp.]